MTEKRVTRRTALKAGAGAGLLTALTGCLDSGSTSGNGDGPSGGGSIDAVPSGATAIAYLDTGQLLDDEMVRRGFNRVIEIFQQQRPDAVPVENYEQALTMVESEIGLDPEGLQSAQFFSGAMGAATGLLFEADWSEDEIISTIENQGMATLTSRSEDGHTIYADDDGNEGFVALADGRYLLAESATIDSVLAVLAGEAEPVSGALADAYADTSGMMRFAADVSEADLSSDEQLSAMDDVDMVSGSLTESGNTRTLSVRMSTSGSSSAADLADQINEGVDLMRSQLDQYPEVEQYVENPGQHLDAVAVSQSGSAVTVTYSGSPELVGEGGMLILAAVVASFALGLGQEVEMTGPQASFDWDYDSSAGTVTITHQSGDTIDGADLSIRGDTGTGPINKTWADYGVDEVMAGSSVTVQNVTDSFDLDLVWVSDDGNDSAILSEFVGPGA
mgnify:CR=1 FL=1